jgi:hypothetical protein
MTRFIDEGYDDDSPDMVLARGRWEHNVRAALKGKRGRKLLAEMREALMMLPQKRLIRDALCTVGADRHKAALLAEAERNKARIDERYAAKYGPALLDTEYAERFAEIVGHQGEGVCINGAWLWYQKVKAGADPDEAFAALPLVFDGDGEDSLAETAGLAQQAGAAFTLAWDLAFRNDEIYELMTPEERYAAFAAWIDAELASTP